MTELIGLTGRKFAGKDTLARMLIEEGAERGLRVVRAAFADKMKVSAARALGFRGTEEQCVAEMDALKQDGSYLTVSVLSSVTGTSARRVSGREYLQWFGTEAHRDVFGPDFWVDALLPLSLDWDKPFEADLIVVTDVRFESEAERIRELGGRIFRVVRGGPVDGDEHVSEAGIADEYVTGDVDNSGPLSDLRFRAAFLLTRW